MNIIGSDKLRFLSIPKNGSTSIKQLVKEHEFIKGWYPKKDSDELHTIQFNTSDLNNEDITFIIPIRRELERQISSFIENIKPNYKNITDHKILKEALKKDLANKKYVCDTNYFENKIFEHFFDNIIKTEWTGAKVLFVNLEDISKKEFIDFCSTIDNRFKDCSIKKVNTTSEDLIKTTITDMIIELSKDKSSGVLDFRNTINWEDRYHFAFFERFKNQIEESKFFIKNF